MTIHRLLYRSDIDLYGSIAGIQQQISQIVRVSQTRNAFEGVTGALLHTRGVFLQVLEGPLSAVEVTFERICSDLRHRRVALLELVEAEDRVFGEWSMARILADQTTERLVTGSTFGEHQRLEGISGQSTIELMQKLLLSSSQQSTAPYQLFVV